VGNRLHYYLFIFLNSLDLISIISYDFGVREMDFPPIQIHQRLPPMKLALRIFVLTIVVAGATAAATPRNAPPITSHQSATASLPVPKPDTSIPPPFCGPRICAVEPAGK
jgi:hypothetical protein